MEFSCPNCGDAETQKLSIVYQGGTSVIETKTTQSGVAFLPGGGVAPMMGGGKTTGTQQTQLAAVAAPPAKYAAVRVLFARLLGGAVVGAILGIFTAGIGFVVCLIIGLIVGIKQMMDSLKYNREVWPGLHAEWETKWLCHRCGGMFVPGGAPQLTPMPDQHLNPMPYQQPNQLPGQQFAQMPSQQPGPLPNQRPNSHPGHLPPA